MTKKAIMDDKSLSIMIIKPNLEEVLFVNEAFRETFKLKKDQANNDASDDLGTSATAF